MCMAHPLRLRFSDDASRPILLPAAASGPAAHIAPSQPPRRCRLSAAVEPTQRTTVFVPATPPSADRTATAPIASAHTQYVDNSYPTTTKYVMSSLIVHNVQHSLNLIRPVQGSSVGTCRPIGPGNDHIRQHSAIHRFFICTVDALGTFRADLPYSDSRVRAAPASTKEPSSERRLAASSTRLPGRGGAGDPSHAAFYLPLVWPIFAAVVVDLVGWP